MKIISQETREKIRQTRLGKKWSEEIKEKFRKAHTGKKLSDEHKKNISIALKGKTLGTHPSRETIQKLRDSHKGHKNSEHQKEVAKQTFTGSNNPRWKGGITPKIIQIRNSKQHEIWRNAVYKRDFYMCQYCLAKTNHLSAHHVRSFVDYPELRFDVNNGITLCRPCHVVHHNMLRNKN